MAFNNSFTAVVGATYTAAQYNTYVRDNFTAIWVYTTAGDIAYASSATALARLGIGAATTVLGSNGSAPVWTHSPPLAGMLHKSGSVDFSPGQSFASTWADVTGASLSLVLSYTCTVLVWAAITGYNATAGRTFYLRANVDGNTDSAPTLSSNGGVTGGRNEALPYLFRIASIGSGTKTVKLQCQADTDPNVVTRGRMIALAFLE